MARLLAVWLLLALAGAAPLGEGALLGDRDAAGVLYCPDGVYPFGTGYLPMKAFRKGTLLRLALPYRRKDWRLGLRYVFRRGRMVPQRLKAPRPFPKVQIGLIEVCLQDGGKPRCHEGPKARWHAYWDPATATLWLRLAHRGPLKAVRVVLRFGEGACGGYLRYRVRDLPW